MPRASLLENDTARPFPFATAVLGRSRSEIREIALDKCDKSSIIVMFSRKLDYRYTEQKPSEADFVRRGDTAE